MISGTLRNIRLPLFLSLLFRDRELRCHQLHALFRAPLSVIVASSNGWEESANRLKGRVNKATRQTAKIIIVMVNKILSKMAAAVRTAGRRWMDRVEPIYWVSDNEIDVYRDLYTSKMWQWDQMLLSCWYHLALTPGGNGMMLGARGWISGNSRLLLHVLSRTEDFHFNFSYVDLYKMA